MEKTEKYSVSIEYENVSVDGNVPARKFFFHILPEDKSGMQAVQRICPCNERFCHSVVLKNGSMKNRTLVVWYRNSQKKKKMTVFHDFPFSLTGFLSAKEENEALDQINEIQGIAEIVVHDISKQSDKEIQVSYHNLEYGVFLSIRTMLSALPEISGGKWILGGYVFSGKKGKEKSE